MMVVKPREVLLFLCQPLVHPVGNVLQRPSWFSRLHLLIEDGLHMRFSWSNQYLRMGIVRLPLLSKRKMEGRI